MEHDAQSTKRSKNVTFNSTEKDVEAKQTPHGWSLHLSLLSPQVTVLASCFYLPRQEINLDNSILFYSLAAVNYVFVDIILPEGRIQWTVFYN